ncbi:GNAT family N-acetyltransferase [Dactylosporangium aurantiacum]|uniref:GNAT family N-acetyltransferase n=1 Tax=Dactylosporangium aurantiacum TaxID=35754 RepID=A0A9Q9IC57_9ACTN|nr:GNAT family N-acetyltransferase [Dactylosporangium aurantiacum]MDG6108067.1 GNAT family N-acetyltransferase [Dactylosporangium aurantiacum]UWZ53699.1 GNAT family N-acetyltransferase [Dactylosporangium aurantiacum]
MRELIVRWQRGWAVARALPTATDVGPGLRVRCLQPGRAVEYVALDRDPASLRDLAALVAREAEPTWLTVPTTDPAATATELEAAGLVLLKRAELLMTTDLRTHPAPPPAAGYRLATAVAPDTDPGTVTVTVLAASGEVGARGTMGLTGTDAVADRIETRPAHRRRGLASTLMGALATAAVAAGGTDGILIASEEGQPLYAKLGWRPAADVLIATTPGNTYPT